MSSQEVTPCSNHTCNAQFCKASDEYITCSLCLQPAYCSDECRLLDWRAHSCPNVHETKNISAGVAVPYFYEDMLTQDELSEVPIDDPIFQSYQVLGCNANRTMQQYIIPSLVEMYAKSKDDETPVARGKNPEQLKGVVDYTIRVVVGGKSARDVVGQIPRDMIYKENVLNERARAISGGGADFKERAKNLFKGGIRRAMRHAETSYIFWPPTQNVMRADIEVDLAGDIDVWLIFKDPSGKEQSISYVSAGYELPVAGKSDISAAARKVQQMFRSQLELKFKGSDYSTKNLYVRRYSDFEGNGVILTFEITPGARKARLLDIEYVVDAIRVKNNVFTGTLDSNSMSEKEKQLAQTLKESESLIQSKYACNVRDFEEMVGLSMAIDTFIASPSSSASSATLRDLDAKSAIIKEYVHKMQANNGEAPESIAPEVDTAVMVAMNVMYEPIEMSQNQWNKKALGTFDNFEMEVNNVITRVSELRAKTKTVNTTTLAGKFKRGVTTVFQKKSALADLKRILEAIDKRTGSFVEDGVSADVQTKWENLKKRVIQAQRSGAIEGPPPPPKD